MEAKILDELLNWCSNTISKKLPMKVRFDALLPLFTDKITFKIIKVAGTNGKGSTASMLASCLQYENTNVGLFTSPHLVSITERFRIKGVQVSLEEILDIVTELKPILYDFVAEKGAEYTPSFFEVLILIGIELFHKKGVEVAIFEAGVGGVNDSTSLLPNILALLTSVGLDHQEKLGETLEEVATNKTGIANPETTLIINSKIPNFLQEIISTTAKLNHVKYLTSNNYITNRTNDLYENKVTVHIEEASINLEPTLKGTFQKENLNLVIEACLFLKKIGVLKNIEAIKGVNTTQWEARFEVVGKNPVWILDAAHNPHALNALVESLDDVSTTQNRILLFGNSEGKDFQKMIALIPKISKTIYIVDSFHRAISQEIIAQQIDDSYVFNKGNGNIQDATEHIIRNHSDKTIVVAGSIFMVGEVRKQLVSKHIIA
ncbi:cyanophycin synthetase [uncultured Kordia sp.]|uniref:bifunctional folylpolyglutamate synthase/dihydrofolate synthase n=1 Tax=uncultured Kordia sp. TaxID=507699 RepID=UPI002639490D|nr:cyanophycin synthetase [uncultured Kordia sp.]